MSDTGYIDHWNEKFLASEWGRYPPEELVRFVGRNFKKLNRGQTKILEIGCGPGANIWFMHREGYQVSGIDGSPAAIESAHKRVSAENAGINPKAPDLRVGNFLKLPWEDGVFDAVVDVFAIYANKMDVIASTVGEIHRVLKPGGLFFSKLWGTETTGYGSGKKLEPNTFDEIPNGPCANMGVSHFFSRDEILKTFSQFQVVSIDRILRTDQHSNSTIEEFVCVFKKA